METSWRRVTLTEVYGRKESLYGTSGLASASQIIDSTDACFTSGPDTAGHVPAIVHVQKVREKRKELEEARSLSFMELARRFVRRDNEILTELAKY